MYSKLYGLFNRLIGRKMKVGSKGQTRSVLAYTILAT